MNMRSKKALKNIVSNLALQVTVIICNFIIPILIIKKFGSNVNGLVSSILQFLAYITLLDSGVGAVVKSYLYKPIASKNKEEIQNIIYASNKFFKLLASIFIVYIIVLCFVYPTIINSTFDKWYTISLILILSLSTFFEYFFGMSYKLFLQTDQKTYIISNIQIAVTILNAILTVILINLNCSIQIVKLVASLIFIVRPIIQNIYVKKKYNLSFKKVDKNYKIDKKWDGLAQHIAYIIHNNTDTVVLSFFSLVDVSIYSVYLLIIKGVKNITNSFINGIDSSFGDMMAKNENDHLNKSFKTYEVFYFTIITIFFICTFILITPFVTVYTRNVTDANYIRPLFGYLIVISEFIYEIRLPYIGLVTAAGHFKETRKGAWIEAITNIVISVVLVYKFGLIGVAIGTIVAMTIRTIEMIYHASKYLLKRNYSVSIKMILVIMLEFCLSVFICSFLPNLTEINYIAWFIKAIMVFIITMIVVLSINLLIYKDEKNNLKSMIKRILRRN